MPKNKIKVENKLIEDNYKLVWSVVNKFHYLKEEKDDLFQSGCIGLIMAAKKFDPKRGNAFSTFAMPYILGEIKNYLRSKNHVKVSKKVLSMQRKIKKVVELNGNISINQIADKLKLSYEDVVLSYNHHSKALSLESSLGDDSRSSLLDMKTIDNRYDIDRRLIEIKDIVKTLLPIEKKILYYRFYYGFSQNEIANFLKISQSKVSRIEKKITMEFKKYYMVE